MESTDCGPACLQTTNQRQTKGKPKGRFFWFVLVSVYRIVIYNHLLPSHKLTNNCTRKAQRPKEPSLWFVVGGFFGIFWEINKKVITLRYWKLLHRVSAPQGAELKGNQVRILNSTRCCKSHTKSDASAHTLPLVVSLLQRLHHIIREGVSTMGTSQKTCPHCKPTAAERHQRPYSAQSKVHVAFEP